MHREALGNLCPDAHIQIELHDSFSHLLLSIGFLRDSSE